MSTTLNQRCCMRVINGSRKHVTTSLQHHAVSGERVVQSTTDKFTVSEVDSTHGSCRLLQKNEHTLPQRHARVQLNIP
jgi:hypothetical protein